MAITLLGSGTQSDPWLISATAHLLQLMDAASGYFRVTQDIPWTLGAGAFYSSGHDQSSTGSPGAKFVDGGGFSIGLQFYFSGSGVRCWSRNVHWQNIHLSIAIDRRSMTGMMFSFCSLQDVSINLRVLGAGSFALFGGATGLSLVSRVFRRVTIAPQDPLSAADVWYSAGESFVGVTVEHAYAYVSTTTLPAGVVRITAYTLANIDALAAGAFSLAGWHEDQGFVKPAPFDVITLNLLTYVSGAAAVRMVWAESLGAISFVGTTDGVGAGTFVLRLPKNAGFMLLCSEEVTANPVSAGRTVAAGSLWFAPVASDYSYIAQQTGMTGSLSGLSWAGTPVVCGAVTFNPVLRRSPAVTRRYGVAVDGLSINITVDATTGGGGGPAIEGDQAYLDGYVEQIHPLLGNVLPIANSEVYAFERRGNAFVAMGYATSNALGEFRVETEVYGGGDIFAFAADFPGLVWQPGTDLELGTKIRPTVNNGYVYEIVTAGNSGATEPTWWADSGDGTEGAIGGATAKARPYYQPVGHGPLKMTLVE